MYCNDCGTTVECDLEAYLKRYEEHGAVRCNACRHSVLRRVAQPELRVRA